jgi:hypothetical protein
MEERDRAVVSTRTRAPRKRTREGERARVYTTARSGGKSQVGACAGDGQGRTGREESGGHRESRDDDDADDAPTAEGKAW